MIERMTRMVWAVCLAATAFGATPVIIDTDMGADDVMAIALILAHGEIPVEAITVVSGLAHVGPGAANARRLVKASGRTGILVLEGREGPLSGTAGFPAEWRATADRPISDEAVGGEPGERAEVWLARRLRDGSRPVRVLALGPLTNLAVALEGGGGKAVEDIVVMGGAFRVAGNLSAWAEANFFVDAEAAARVFRSGVAMRVVPLDATNRVKMDRALADRLARSAKGPLGEAVKRVLESVREGIDRGEQYAWDALAAAVVVDAGVATWSSGYVTIRVAGKEAGRSVMEARGPNARVALDADRRRFEEIFLGAFR